jgi:hypothetical protein
VTFDFWFSAGGRRGEKKFVSPYMGKIESEKVFGGKLFGQSEL